MSRTIWLEHAVDVDELIGEVDDRDLLLECKERGFSLKMILEATRQATVLDVMKIELVSENINKKTLQELEEFFK